MNIESFQKKLGEIIKLAKYNNNILDHDLIKQFFGKDNLNKDQIVSIFEYLQSQGVHIKNGPEDIDTEPENPVPYVAEKSPDPLTEEEEEYLKDYQEGAKDGFASENEEKQLLKDAADGNKDAEKRLIEAYVPEVISSVRKFHRSEIPVGDMLQEGNLGLISAMEGLSDHDEPDARKWILDSIDRAVLSSIQAQEQQDLEDGALVGQVQKLESAVKSLTDESEDKFSVEELSALLDMSVDEIKDVLRLTGDDK